MAPENNKVSRFISHVCIKKLRSWTYLIENRVAAISLGYKYLPPQIFKATRQISIVEESDFLFRFFPCIKTVTKSQGLFGSYWMRKEKHVFSTWTSSIHFVALSNAVLQPHLNTFSAMSIIFCDFFFLFVLLHCSRIEKLTLLDILEHFRIYSYLRTLLGTGYRLHLTRPIYFDRNAF